MIKNSALDEGRDLLQCQPGRLFHFWNCFVAYMLREKKGEWKDRRSEYIWWKWRVMEQEILLFLFRLSFNSSWCSGFWFDWSPHLLLSFLLSSCFMASWGEMKCLRPLKEWFSGTSTGIEWTKVKLHDPQKLMGIGRYCWGLLLGRKRRKKCKTSTNELRKERRN